MDPKALFDRFPFQRRPPAPPSEELAEALGQLDRLGASRPELFEPSRQLGRLLAASFAVAGEATDRPKDRDRIVAGWDEGKPAFAVAVPDLSRAAIGERFRRLLAVADDSAAGVGPLRALAGRKGFDADATAWGLEVVAGRPERVEQDAERLGVDPLLTCSMLRLAMLPALAKLSATLEQTRTAEWERGDCPLCASRPLLAESRGLEQRIVLRCGLCAAGWDWRRLRCPSCGETVAKALHYSFVEGEQQRFRLAHCDTCQWNWKVVATLAALSAPGLIVADLASVHLDLFTLG